MLVEQLPLLNLQIVDLQDTTCIAISDLSVYTIVPDSTELAFQITPPNYPTLNVPFTPGNVNVYKCVDLGITCSDTGCTPLPDGIYEVVYSISVPLDSPPSTIERHFIKIDQIKCAYQHAFIMIDMDCHGQQNYTNTYMTQVKRAELYITSCVAESNRGNYVLAWKYYEKANYILNQLARNFSKRVNGFFGNCGCR